MKSKREKKPEEERAIMEHERSEINRETERQRERKKELRQQRITKWTSLVPNTNGPIHATRKYVRRGRQDSKDATRMSSELLEDSSFLNDRREYKNR